MCMDECAENLEGSAHTVRGSRIEHTPEKPPSLLTSST